MAEQAQIQRLKYWRVPMPLTGNGFFFGRTDSGKSWKMLAIVQGYHSHGYKIWDLFGGKRHEGPFWSFESEESRLWKEFEAEVGIMKGKGPKRYKVNLLVPMFSTELPSKYAEDLPRVATKVFTIPFHSIDLEDVSTVTGPLSNNARYLWNQLKHDLGKEANGEDIRHLMNTKYSGYKNLSIYKLFLRPAINNHLIGSRDFDLNLDFVDEAKEKDRISVLVDDFVPPQFKFFVISWMQRNIMDLAMNDKIHKKNIGVMREVNMFMKVQDKSKEDEDRTQIFRNQVSDVARYARSGLFLFMDTQSPYEVKGLIEGQEDILGINEMPGAKDRDELCDQLKRDRRINDVVIRLIAKIPVFKMVLVTRGERAKILQRVMPPRNQCWKPTCGNFNSFWGRRINKWVKLKPYIDQIKKEYAERNYEWEEKLRKEREKKEEEKRKKEEEALKAKAERQSKRRAAKSEPEKTDLEQTQDDVNKALEEKRKLEEQVKAEKTQKEIDELEVVQV